MTHDSHDDNVKTTIEWHYLLYDFGTCTIWLIEVFFNVLDYKEYFDSGEGEGVGEESLLQPSQQRVEWTKRRVIFLWVEVTLAAYFFIDSTSIAYHLSRMDIHRQSRGMTFDVCFNMMAYALMVYYQYADWKASRNIGGQEEAAACAEQGTHPQVVYSEEGVTSFKAVRLS